MLKDIGEQLVIDNPCGYPCPDCPNQTIYYRFSQAQCWEWFNDNDPLLGPSIIYYPCDFSGWCEYTYDVCCTGGVKTVTIASTLVDGTADCSSLPNPWPEGTCAAINCN
jgi:hypothetical protein